MTRATALGRVAAVLAMGFLLAFAPGCGGRRSEQYRLQADTYFGLGKHAEAADAYRKAVEADPENALAKVGLGRCLIIQQKNDEALEQFKGAMAVRPPVSPAYAEAAWLLIEQGKAAEAMAAVDELVKADALHGSLLKASVQLRQGMADEAVSGLLALRETNKESSEVALSLAVAQLAAGKAAEAESLLRTLIERADATLPAARMALVLASKAQGTIDKLVSEYEPLASAANASDQTKLAYAFCLVAAGKIDEGNTIVQAALQKEPGSGWANYVAAQTMLARNESADVSDLLRTASAKLPDDPVVTWVATGRRKDVAPAVAASDAAPQSRVPASSAAHTPEDWRELWTRGALDTLLQDRAIFLKSTDASVSEYLLISALILGRSDVLNELKPALPANSRLREYLSTIESKNADGLKKLLDSWKEEDPERQTLLANATAIALAGMGARSAAVQHLVAAQNASQNNGALLFNVVQILRVAGAESLALNALQRLIDLHPDNLDAHSLRYALLSQSGKKPQALAAAETAYALFPDAVTIVVDLTQAYLDNNNATAAEAVIARARTTHPESKDLAAAHVAVLLHKNQPAEAKAVLDSSNLSLDAGLPSVFAAMAAAMMNDWSAVSALAEGSKDEPIPLSLWLLNVGAHAKAGNLNANTPRLDRKVNAGTWDGQITALVSRAAGLPSEALREDHAALADALAKDLDSLGDFTFALASQSLRLHTAAYALLKKTSAKLPPSLPLFSLTLNSLSMAAGTVNPVEEARQLIKPLADNPHAWLGLQSIAQAAGDKTAERGALDQAIALAPDDPLILFQRGLLEEREKQLDKAIPQYRRLVELQPDNVAANNNLAYCLLQTGEDLPGALAMAEKAAKARSGDPHILHTLGVAQLRSGKLDESEKSLRVALEMMPVEPTLLLDYGLLQIAKGEKDNGLAHIRLALQYTDNLGLDFPRRAEAEAAIKQG